MHTNEREGEIRVELFERSELPPPAQEQADGVHRQLDTLAQQGEISTLTRTEWNRRAQLDDCDRDVRDTYLALSQWATENGVRLSPFFQTRERFCTDSGDYTDWLVFPAMCLVVYEGDEISAVYPHADENTTQTVQDGVESLFVDDFDDSAPEPTLAD